MKMSDGGRPSLCDDCETPAFNIGFNKALSVYGNYGMFVALRFPG